MSTVEQRSDALQRANASRLALASIRRELREDPDRMRTVLLAPPEVVGGMLLVDVLLLPMVGRRVTSSALPRLGMWAVHDHVNLLVEVERAPVSARRWVADHARWEWSGRKLRLIVERPRPDAAAA